MPVPAPRPTPRPRPSLRSASALPASPRRWTKAARLALLSYLGQLQEEMRLLDWTIEVDWTPSPSDTHATVTPVHGQRRAILQLGPSFLLEALEHQRHTLVHELVHCHLFPLTELVRVTNDASLDPTLAEALWPGFMLNVEYSTDALADAFAPLMPLPHWPAPPSGSGQ